MSSAPRVTRGSIVVVPFAYKEATGAKVRPALALADERDGQVILCMITSTEPPDDESIAIGAADLVEGSLPNAVSHVRPARLFTANTLQGPRIRARLSEAKTTQAADVVRAMLAVKGS